jgi:hypothetical protein
MDFGMAEQAKNNKNTRGCLKRGVWGWITPTCGGYPSPRILYICLGLTKKFFLDSP